MRSTEPPASSIERFIFPAPSANTRSPAIFRARRSGSSGRSSAPAATSRTYPVPISPRSFPSTRTDARETRWRTTRTAAQQLNSSAWDDAVRVVDAVDLAHGRQQPREVRDVSELEREPQHRDAIAADGGRLRHDVDVVVGEHGRDVGEQPGTIERLDL